MGTTDSLVSLTAEEIGERVASLGSSYFLYRDKIISDGLRGDIIIDFIQSDEKISELFAALKLDNIVHRAVIKKTLIDPLNAVETKQLSSPRSKLQKAKEQDDIIAQSLSKNEHSVKEVNYNFFKSYNSNWVEIKIPIKKRVNTVKYFKQWEQSTEKGILPKVEKISQNVHFPSSISFIPCKKSFGSFFISNEEFESLVELWSFQPKTPIFHWNQIPSATYKDEVSGEIKSFTLEEQNRILQEWRQRYIEQNKKLYENSVNNNNNNNNNNKEECRCLRCKFNTKSSDYYYIINWNSTPIKYRFISGKQRDISSTANFKEIQFSLKKTIDLKYKYSEVDMRFFRQIGENKYLLLGYYATDETNRFIEDLMTSSTVDLKRDKKHLRWWLGSIIPKFKKDFIFSQKKCPLKIPCNGLCQCNIPPDGFFLQAAYSDRYGDDSPSLSIKRNMKNMIYKYSNGNYLVDETIFIQFQNEKSETIILPQIIKKSIQSNIIASKSDNTSIVIHTKETTIQSTLNWPLNISKYEKFYQINKAKFDALVKRMIEKDKITIFLSSPFDGCGDERVELMKKFPALIALCQSKGIQLTVIDFRTGITKDIEKENKTILKCFRAIDDTDIFIGYFGARYGSSTLSSNGKTDWIHQAVDICSEFGYSYLRSYIDRSVTEMEWQHAFLHDKDGIPYYIRDNKPISFFFFRSQNYDSLKAKSSVNDKERDWYKPEKECIDAANKLKQKVSELTSLPNTYGSCINNYENPVIGAEVMYACCESLIMQLLQIPKVLPLGSPSYQTHLCYARARKNIYVKIDDEIIVTVNSYIEHLDSRNSFNQPLLITGESGCGKSSLMALIVLQLLQKENPKPFIFFHFCGCDNASHSLPDILRRLYSEFCDLVKENRPKYKYQLKDVTTISINDIISNEIYDIYDGIDLPPVVILIDAINELDNKRYENYIPTDMKWLPDTLHPRIKIVLSSLSGKMIDNLRSSEKIQSELILQPLNEEQRELFVTELYKQSHKEVDKKNLSLLWSSHECRNIMYLSLVVKDVILHATYTTLNNKSYLNDLLLAKSVPSLLSKMIKVIESNTIVNGVFQNELLEKILCYVYCSREGLTIEELQEITNCKDPTYWSSFQYDLNQIITIRQGLVNLTHNYVYQAIEQTYIYNGSFFNELKDLTDKDSLYKLRIGRDYIKERHIELAVMFKLMVDSGSHEANKGSRFAREQEYHERKANMRPSVTVVIRVRPPNREEQERKEQLVLNASKNHILLIHPKRGGHNFNFNFVLSDKASQSEVYQVCGEDIVSQVLQENNVTVIAYGQTSSGKTHTIFGAKSDITTPTEEGIGLIPRTLNSLINELEEHKINDGWNWEMTCTMVEVYNNEVFDLLQSKKSYALGEDYYKQVITVELSKSNQYIYTDNTEMMKTIPLDVKLIKNDVELEGKKVTKREHIESMIKEGDQNRIMRTTALNRDSSRSHCITTIQIKREHRVYGRKRVVKLNLVDLAGSERLSRIINSDDIRNKRENVNLIAKESASTNKSLFVLNKCILALSNEKIKHVPYRESMLTTVLQDSLGGSSKLIMIATVSPTENNYDETLNTLKYASLSKSMATSKNKIIALAAMEKNRKDELDAMEFLCKEFGVSENHIKLYDEFYTSKKGKAWLDNITNSITWRKEKDRWISKLDEFNKKLVDNIQYIRSFKAICTDSSCQRHLRVKPGEKITCQVNYTYFDRRGRSQLQIMIDHIHQIKVTTETRGESDSKRIKFSAPKEEGIYMIWTRSALSDSSNIPINYTNCDIWFKTFIAWLEVSINISSKPGGIVASYGNIEPSTFNFDLLSDQELLSEMKRELEHKDRQYLEATLVNQIKDKRIGELEDTGKITELSDAVILLKQELIQAKADRDKAIVKSRTKEEELKMTEKERLDLQALLKKSHLDSKFVDENGKIDKLTAELNRKYEKTERKINDLLKHNKELMDREIVHKI